MFINCYFVFFTFFRILTQIRRNNIQISSKHEDTCVEFLRFVYLFIYNFPFSLSYHRLQSLCISFLLHCLHLFTPSLLNITWMIFISNLKRFSLPNFYFLVPFHNPSIWSILIQFCQRKIILKINILKDIALMQLLLPKIKFKISILYTKLP